MMKWGLDQIAGISAIAKRFTGTDDSDLLILLDRIKQLEDAYDDIEKSCEDINEFTIMELDSLNKVTESIQQLFATFKDSKEAPIFRAHMDHTHTEYSKWIKAKIDIEASDFLLNELQEKHSSLDELKNRIANCDKSCSNFKDMQLHVNQLKKKGIVDDALFTEYNKLKVVVEQQKLQLQSDVHFIIEKETPFIEHAYDIILGMTQRTVAHNNALLVQDPPKYLIDPSAPFVEGKEDSEIDFTVAPGGFHILPLSMKKGREIIWAISTFNNDINFRIMFKDEKMNEKIIVPIHKICSGLNPVQGSFVGTASGMLELMFDNSNALIRSKKIHVRLGEKESEVSEVSEETKSSEVCEETKSSEEITSSEETKETKSSEETKPSV